MTKADYDDLRKMWWQMNAKHEVCGTGISLTLKNLTTKYNFCRWKNRKWTINVEKGNSHVLAAFLNSAFSKGQTKWTYAFCTQTIVVFFFSFRLLFYAQHFVSSSASEWELNYQLTKIWIGCVKIIENGWIKVGCSKLKQQHE